MSFVQNGSFEALAQATVNVNNSTESNPFGLKDFSRLLDAKFGNSAFSSNLLEAPRGNIKAVNPFDNKAMDTMMTKTRGAENAGNGRGSSTRVQQAGNGKNQPAKVASLFGSANNDNFAATNSVFTSCGDSAGGRVKFGGFNKGTGMSTGPKVRHKLDFCY